MVVFLRHLSVHDLGQVVEVLRIFGCPAIDAKRASIHPFCITVDKNRARLPTAPVRRGQLVLVDNVRKLPLKVSDIYRWLTL